MSMGGMSIRRFHPPVIRNGNRSVCEDGCKINHGKDAPILSFGQLQVME